MSNLSIKTHQWEGKKVWKTVGPSLFFFFLSQVIKAWRRGGKTSRHIYATNIFYEEKGKTSDVTLELEYCPSLYLHVFCFVFVPFDSRKNSIVLRTQLSVRVHGIMGELRLLHKLLNVRCVTGYKISVFYEFADKLLHSEGRELRRALFSLKQIFQVLYKIDILRRRRRRKKPQTVGKANKSSYVAHSGLDCVYTRKPSVGSQISL